jgi:hypothetical protein
MVPPRPPRKGDIVRAEFGLRTYTFIVKSIDRENGVADLTWDHNPNFVLRKAAFSAIRLVDFTRVDSLSE